MIDMFFEQEHYKWFFSGLGVFIIGLIIYRQKVKNRISKRQNQKIGKGSTGIQAGRDINIKND